MRRILHICPFDLADIIQFSVITQHYAHHRPDTQQTVLTYRKHLPYVWADEVLPIEEPLTQKYDYVWRHKWIVPQEDYYHYPSTAAMRCLFEEVHLCPVPDLLKYKVPDEAPIADDKKMLTDLAEIRLAVAQDVVGVAVWGDKHPMKYLDHPGSLFHYLRGDHVRLVGPEGLKVLQPWPHRVVKSFQELSEDDE